MKDYEIIAYLLNQVKTSIRVKHNKLDNDIISTIKAAENEMKRLNIATLDKIEDYCTGDLRIEAIKTYCKYIYSDPKYADGFLESYRYQLDCLSKSDSYKEKNV